MPVDHNPCNASPGMPFCKLKVVQLYAHSDMADRRAARGGALAAILNQSGTADLGNWAEPGLAQKPEFLANSRNNGRHEETRTPDLYRVNLQLT